QVPLDFPGPALAIPSVPGERKAFNSPPDKPAGKPGNAPRDNLPKKPIDKLFTKPAGKPPAKPIDKLPTTPFEGPGE
ncbi:MAG TPA: hypothetical protein VEI07_21445, partial [Planctomycetaceae bacterium]|nr:hypothetical protein [Planctomycetaceae bacterium]